MKFNEDRSKGPGDMERTRNIRVNPMTLKVDLESTDPVHGICTLSPLSGTLG